MNIDDVARMATDLEGVNEKTVDGLRSWRYHGRLVAREIDESTIVIRTYFDARDAMLTEFAQTFSVTPRYERHMMVLADLAEGEADAINDAVKAAWRLQAEND